MPAERKAKRRPSAGMVIAVMALIAALAGTAVAGQLAATSVLNKKEKKQTKNIATNLVGQLAPNLVVGKAVDANAVNGVSEAAFTVSRSGSDASCDPGALGVFIDCVGVTLTLPRSGRVLIVATGGQVTFSSAPTGGECRLEADDATAAVPGLNSIKPGELADNTTDQEAVNGFAYTAVTNVLPAGSHTFKLSCDQADSDTEIDDSSITATMIGAG